MFAVIRTVRLRETDATGVIYFTEQLSWAQEAFEEYLISRGWTLDTLMPIVHVEANYTAPLHIGDRVEIRLFLEQMGTSSFTLSAQMQMGEKEVGRVRITHVTISKGASIPLPEKVKDLLKNL